MTKKLIFSLSFLFVAILLTAGSCGVNKPTPKPKLDNLQPTTPLNFSAQVGQSDSKTFRFENTGDATLEYSITTTLSQLSITDSANGTLALENTATVTVVANCSAVGTFPGSITVTSTNNGGNGSVDVSLTCTEPPPAGDYNIQLIPVGAGMTEERQDVFEAAAGLWKAAIVGDLPDLVIEEGDLPANSACITFATPAFVGTIDDLLIFATIAPIDGVGGTLGEAGPSFNRLAADGELSIIGCMRFDEADVAALEADGTFNEVILHEMGHVLGIGTFWEPLANFNSRNLLDTPCRSVPGAISGFIGANVADEFVNTLGGSGNAPVENEFGGGTRCSHWDEAFFDNELMTGFLGGVTSATVNPLSILTIASLEDLGYEVDNTQAEPYSIPACSPTCGALTSSASQTPWEVILSPKGYIGKDGKIIYFNQPK
jgi:hypothetical protein